MKLPEELQQAIDIEFEHFGWRQIHMAREELTARYRQQANQNKSPFMTSDAHRYAYVATRMPATYAALLNVFKEVRSRDPPISIKSLLDLGSGPGTAMWAAQEVFPELEMVALVEKDLALIDLGKRLASHSSQKSISRGNWLSTDLEQIQNLPEHDLIILSYSIGELSPSSISALLDKCWRSVKQFLVVIEPGTPMGFERIRAVRQQLINLKAHMVAPCPHIESCPIKNGDWCHFSARLERSHLHQRLKEGSLGYEDEKYSYVAFSKTASELPLTRVLRHPVKRSGHINLTLCAKDDVKHLTISKRSGDDYKAAKKLEWGSPFNLLRIYPG